MSTSEFKGTDKEGRIRLGSEYANKQWMLTPLDNGSIVLVPMVPVTDLETDAAFEKALKKHKKTIDLLK